MAINPICNACQQELSIPGAVLFSPPDVQQLVMKLHLCTDCFRCVVGTIDAIAEHAATPLKRDKGD